MAGIRDALRSPASTLSKIVKPPAAGSRSFRAFRRLTDFNVWIYRRTGGRVGGRMDRGRVLLLHHVGRKSGVARVTPLVHLADGDNLVIVASMGGWEQHPAWFLNLRATPDTLVEVGRERRRVRARVASAEEKAALWPRLLEIYPGYQTYQDRTTRDIPVVILEPAG